MMGGSHWIRLVHLKPSFCKFAVVLAGNHGKSWGYPSFSALLMIGSLACFFVVMGSSFLSIFPLLERIGETNRNRGISSNGSFGEKCDVFDGDWVVDESYPLYNATLCPFLERGFDCLGNGRRDKDYLKWRWKPKSCEIPRFDVRPILEWLRGKRIVFVGDSLSRTQWESMVCILLTGIDDKTSVYEVNGNEITKQIRHLAIRFEPFNSTVEFYRSVFLVQPAPAPKHSPKRAKMVLKLDKMDNISRKWRNADVLIFNSGHWWSSTKLFEMGWYFQIDGKMKLGLPISKAFQFALATWKSWVENALDPHRTQVFFRTFESTHWSSGRQNCKVTTQPFHEITAGGERSWISDSITTAVESVSFPVKLLNVTQMGAFRSDAHVGSWSDNPSVPDCSHWCLPGVPDMWNELLFSLFLLSHDGDLV